MSKPKLRWGLSIQQLESIADSTPNMTAAELVEKIHQVAGGDDAGDETSDREVFQIASISEIMDAENLFQPKEPSQQPTQPTQAAISSAPQEPSQTNAKDFAVSTPGLSSAYAAAGPAEASAVETTPRGQFQSLYPPIATVDTDTRFLAATSQGAANSGGYLPNAVAPAYGPPSFTSSTPGVSHYFPQQPVVTSGSHAGPRQSLMPQDHHASLESYGHMTAEDLLAHGNSIDISQLYGSLLLRIALEKMPENKVTKMLNGKRAVDRPSARARLFANGNDSRAHHSFMGACTWEAHFSALSAVPSSWTIESMLDPPTPAAPAQSMPAPRRKRPATASSTQSSQPASKRRQGAAVQQSQLPQPRSTSQTYAMPPEHPYQSEPGEGNGPSQRDLSQYPTDESTLTNGLLDFLQPSSQSTFQVGSWMQEGNVPPSSPPVARYTSYNNDTGNVNAPPSSPPAPRYSYYHDNAGNMGSTINSDAVAGVGVTPSAYGRSDGYLFSDAPGNAVQQFGSDGTFSQWQPPRHRTLSSDFWGNETPAGEGAEVPDGQDASGDEPQEAQWKSTFVEKTRLGRPTMSRATRNMIAGSSSI
ncbi:hypothetical protein CKM354_000024700 [Cercospora kikuchii]|uniref:Uncharacterized protein n=1 Tax=Cercospora kikuchii TaxID=84275 RepID=A0A9P3FBP1_9PEZI|nr:uncharacterized protein CKM354_000024700 [Cercospora kikuchii]GIZ36780.1 hypothetical protein CKM354_000024700 [Cercospora kikuchii]